MKKAKPSKSARQPVADVVHQILEHARAAKTDGPSSGLFGRDAQLSGALTQAGTLLAKFDRAPPPSKKSSVLTNLLGAPAPKTERPRRAWFFRSAKTPAMPRAKRIEELLQARIGEGRRLVLDRDVSDKALSANGDVDCVLPEGAVDPVCTPR